MVEMDGKDNVHLAAMVEHRRLWWRDAIKLFYETDSSSSLLFISNTFEYSNNSFDTILKRCKILYLTSCWWLSEGLGSQCKIHNFRLLLFS